MRRNPLLIDAGIALVLGILVIAIAPGLAIVGLLAILVVLICAISFGIDRLRRRRRANPVADLRRSRAPGDSRAPRGRPASSPRRTRSARHRR